MILKNRLFDRQPPSEEAKSIFIFCEGARREQRYFEYFREIDSRVKIEVHPLDASDNNSPLGLLRIAEKAMAEDYDFREGDEVWIVVDVDPDKANSRLPQFEQIRQELEVKANWFFVQSNPCFEVWLYYHFKDELPSFTGDNYCANWKSYLPDQVIPGGFDSRKHPLLLSDAVRNAKSVFRNELAFPAKGCTNVYLLGESVWTLTGERITEALAFYREERDA